MSTVTLLFEEKTMLELEKEARSKGLTVDQLLQNWVAEQLKTRKQRFEEAMNYVLEKNHELYQRLA